MLENNVNIEKACKEYNDSVKLSLVVINRQLDDALTKCWNGLDELSMKIEARTGFLDKNPTFLSCLLYNKDNIRCNPISEFGEIKITLQEHVKRYQEKLDEVEKHHRKLFDLIMVNGHDRQAVDQLTNPKDDDDDFQDALDRVVDRVTIVEHAFSEMNLSSSSSDIPRKKFQLFDDIHTTADVQRRKPQADLHDKLIQQAIATDSLEGFIKLMNRKPEKGKMKKKSENLENKYSNSLWFFPSKSATKKKTLSDSRSSKQTLSASTCCNLLVTSSQPSPLSSQERTRKTKQSLGRQKLKYYDVLDDLDTNDLKPIKSEYPRRDIEPIELQEAKSYLHRMMEENDRVWKKLLQPEKKKKPQKPQPSKAKQVRNLMEYLTAPQQKYLDHVPQSLIVMPVKIIYDNVPTKDTPRRGALVTDLTKSAEPKRMEGRFLQSKTEAKLLPESRSSPFPVHRKKEMLDQLRGLKLRNDNIQKNIQRAIEVIESRMIDLLASPTDATSSDAFNDMEQEITSVLKLMSDSEQRGKEKVKRGSNLSTPKGKKPGGGDQRTKRTNQKKEKSHQSGDTTARTTPRKGADMEDGERLLGQVDNVIQKIDNMYTRFYEDCKGRNPSPIEHKCWRSAPQGRKQAAVFYQTHIYYSGRIEFPSASEDKEEFGAPEDTELEALYKEEEVPTKGEEEEVVPTKNDEEEEVVPIKNEEEAVPAEVKEEVVPTKQEEPLPLVVLPMDEAEEEFFSPGDQQEVPRLDQPEEELLYDDESTTKAAELRHENALEAFYTLFFSSIFVALNLDYAT